VSRGRCLAAAGVALVGLLVAACGTESAEVTGDQPGGSTSTNYDFPDPAGEEWELAQAGETLGVKWEFFTTPSDQGGVCTSFQFDPSDSGDPAPSRLYKGKALGCGDRFSPWRHIEFIAGRQEPRAAYSYVVAVTDGNVRQVELAFSDGSRETAQVIKDTVVVIYPTTKTLESLVLTMADSTLDDCTVRWDDVWTALPLCLESEPAPPSE
jgi:hypothetical protein